MKIEIEGGVGRKCPECGRELMKRDGWMGEFIGCSGYPECKYIETDPFLGADHDSYGDGE